MSVRLVPLSGRHAQDLAALAGGDAPWAGISPASPPHRALAFIERAQRLRARDEQATFAVCDTARLIGIALLARDGTTPDRAELGYWIAARERGQGYATAAAQRVVTHGFGRMGLVVIFARCPSANRASIRVLDKIGCRFVGVEPAEDPTSAGDPIQRYELTCHEWRSAGPQP